MMPPRPACILLVEDNPGDVRLAREVLQEIGATAELHVARDGVEALAFLHRVNGHAAAPRPDLILLDLNLPRLDGRETLAEIKSDQRLRQIPVVVFSSSSSEDDVSRCYALHANCYITKPADFVEFERVFRAIEGFWLGVVRLPGGGPP